MVVNANASAELAVTGSLAGGGPLVKGGLGALVLTGTADQLNFSNPETHVTLNSGSLRAVASGPQANLGPNNVLQFRGGTLVSSTTAGGQATFARGLGPGAGQVNWATSADDHGFGVVGGGNLAVNLGGAGGPVR